MSGRGWSYSLKGGCEGVTSAINTDPALRLMPTDADEDTTSFDPTTPKFANVAETELSAAYTSVDTLQGVDVEIDV